MFDELKSWDHLSQVIFIHDYVQLIFQDNYINVYNQFIVENSNGESFNKGKLGYADAAVKLIDSKITNIEYHELRHFKLTFNNGGTLSILLNRGVSEFPEAFELNSSQGVHIEFNT